MPRSDNIRSFLTNNHDLITNFRDCFPLTMLTPQDSQDTYEIWKWSATQARKEQKRQQKLTTSRQTRERLNQTQQPILTQRTIVKVTAPLPTST